MSRCTRCLVLKSAQKTQSVAASAFFSAPTFRASFPHPKRCMHVEYACCGVQGERKLIKFLCHRTPVGVNCGTVLVLTTGLCFFPKFWQSPQAFPPENIPLSHCGGTAGQVNLDKCSTQHQCTVRHLHRFIGNGVTFWFARTAR